MNWLSRVDTPNAPGVFNLREELNIFFTWAITISASRRKQRKNGFHVPLLLHLGLLLHVIDIRD
jgi:hypothetical protein